MNKSQCQRRNIFHFTVSSKRSFCESNSATFTLVFCVWCVQERREREQQDLEFAKEMAEDDDDSFPWSSLLTCVRVCLHGDVRSVITHKPPLFFFSFILSGVYSCRSLNFNSSTVVSLTETNKIKLCLHTFVFGFLGNVVSHQTTLLLALQHMSSYIYIYIYQVIFIISVSVTVKGLTLKPLSPWNCLRPSYQLFFSFL